MTTRRHTQSSGYSKEDLDRLNKAIQQLTVDVDGDESQPCELEEALQEEGASGNIKDKLAWLEASLQRAREAMVRQLREYQELMVIKLDLDFEIATYHKLLEGEKKRLGLRGEAESLRAGSDALETSTAGCSHPLCDSSGCAGEFSCRDFPGC